MAKMGKSNHAEDGSGGGGSKKTKAGKKKERAADNAALNARAPEQMDRGRPPQPSFFDPKLALLALIGVTLLNIWRYVSRVRAPAPAPEVEVGGHTLDLSGIDDE
mmetsp:Transcript_118733/g.221964  ORF Transcript_118733/g.221964 Transcript_118733/m.221964 type:complete len:105 (-) Transcript_118733:137-451(-)